MPLNPLSCRACSGTLCRTHMAASFSTMVKMYGTTDWGNPGATSVLLVIAYSYSTFLYSFQSTFTFTFQQADRTEVTMPYRIQERKMQQINRWPTFDYKTYSKFRDIKVWLNKCVCVCACVLVYPGILYLVFWNQLLLIPCLTHKKKLRSREVKWQS